MAAERNSDGSYDAVDSGGFGKDYHGQDAFGERIGGTGIGGSHFGGKAAGDFSGADELGEGHFTERYTDYGQAMATESPTEVEDATEVASNMRDTLRDVNTTETENSNTGSMDTSFQIGDLNKDEIAERLRKNKEFSKEDIDIASENLKEFLRIKENLMTNVNEMVERMKSKNPFDKIASTFGPGNKGFAIESIEELSREYGVDLDRAKLESDIKTNGPDAITEAMTSTLSKIESVFEDKLKSAKDAYNSSVAAYDSYLKSSFTDKTTKSKEKKAVTPSEVMKAATSTEAKPGKNMSSAKTSPSDYLTKANKDSTKEIAPNRNDFGNHAVDTLKGVTDRITGSVTADALGLKSIEEFARENGYNPEKLSTMKAYQSYQNKEIMKAIPGIVKQIGSYITERVKDAVDPSQLPERIRNTLARYNLATLIGAAILSISSGAGLQASLDQALTMVDPEDQAAVSDYLEDVLNDEGTVNDLKTAFDDALAPEQNSDTNELDESIVSIGRKDNTDYSGFNAGLGTSGTTSSDADVKVFIARNVKADPILRKMISSKMGK